jgi:CRISPR-associated protein Cas5h
MRGVRFEIEGPWGLFRKPYAPVSPVSYPLPPPTAILGLVGAVCGYGKHEYHERIGWRSFRAGVRLLRPVRTFRAALNLLNTKDKLDALWRPSKENHRMQIPFEFLVAPAYRIWVSGLEEEAAAQLVERLTGLGPVYTPVLGLANCLADVRFVVEGELEELGPNGTVEPLDCVVPLVEGASIDYDPKRGYQRLRVPATMDPQRKVHRYPEVVVADDAGSVLASGVPRYRLGDDVFCLI